MNLLIMLSSSASRHFLEGPPEEGLWESTFVNRL